MDFEAGYHSFDTSSSWSSPITSISQSSFQLDSTQQDDFDLIHTCSRMHCDHDVHMLGADGTNDVGSWMQQTPASRDAQFIVDPTSFGHDFVLYDSQDSTVSTDWQQDVSHEQLYGQSLAAAEARVFLAPSIIISPPASQETKLPPSRRASNHTKNLSTTVKGDPARSIIPAQRRRRAERPRLPCSTAGCQKSFSRASDLDRHLRNIHNQSREYYECSSHHCLYRTRRKDKMQEHCQKVHAHVRGAEVYSVVAESDAYTPGSSTASTPSSTFSDT